MPEISMRAHVCVHSQCSVEVMYMSTKITLRKVRLNDRFFVFPVPNDVAKILKKKNLG